MFKSLLSVLALTTLLAVACNKQETAPAPSEGAAVQQETTTEEAHEAAEQMPANEDGSSTESQSE